MTDRVSFLPATPGLLALATVLLLTTEALAGVASTSTTTTTFGGTTTTTMFTPTDVTGGGRFEGGFPKGSFDSYSFELTEPRVLVAEITNGFGGCPGDTYVELRQLGGPGDCMGNYGPDLPCIAFDDDAGISLCSLLIYRIEVPGVYEIRVSAFAGGKITRYFMDVDFVETECGNGAVEVSEECDDGNLDDGDCCSSTCTLDGTGASCNDGVFCNGADTCDAGAQCSQHAGDPCPGPDGDGNCSETCDEEAGACSGADPDATPCQDGTFCNGADQCSGGACSVHAGNPCPGPDGDGNCSETCDEGADACTAADSNGSPCNDGLFCNGTDACSAGVCSQHAGNPCPGVDGDVDCSEGCNEAADACTANDPDGSDCEDGLFCNGDDTCLGGLCNQHTGLICPGVDGDGDCAESCSDSEGGCTGNDPQGAPCDDGIFCNGADTCSGGTCSVHEGNPCPGPDGDGNCAESCNEAADTCTAADPVSSPCSDGVFCNGADTCAGGTCSMHAGNPCPGADGDGNCAESCDEAADTCSAADPNGSGCADGLFCNGADTCLAGFCTQHAGDPCPGPDGDGNCAETCSEAADTCTGSDPNQTACNDGIFCNGADTCSGGSCSQHAGNPCPGADGDSNCAESCDETLDDCKASDPDQSTCTDGLFCNGTDRCQAGSCSQHTGNPCGGPDGDGNCTESCNELGDNCAGADPNGSACNDGLFCNGSDTCGSGSCSQHTGSPCPGADGDGSCKESCNEASDLCNANDPDGSLCNDGEFCNGSDRCAGGTCSTHFGTPCGDGDLCTADTCTEETDLCSYEPVDPCSSSTTTTLSAAICGDISGDGSVKAGDALLVLRAAVGGDQCSAAPCVCDANGNGTITAPDAQLVLRFAVGVPVEMLCPC